MTMVNLVNLTPHAITLMPADGQSVTIPPSGAVARCAVRRVQIGMVRTPDGPGVPINRTEFGAVEGLPAPAPDTIYIVSAIVAQAAHRDDVVIVDEVVRDSEGRIVGARALARV